MKPMSFPAVPARDLLGNDRVLPGGFAGTRNVVIVAFEREHQALVDSWVPWLEARAGADPEFRFYEVPTLSRVWAPARRFIDGGMAATIRNPVVLERTLTVYGDRRRLTEPLGIDDLHTIWLFVVDSAGVVHAHVRGGQREASTQVLEAALEELRAAQS